MFMTREVALDRAEKLIGRMIGRARADEIYEVVAAEFRAIERAAEAQARQEEREACAELVEKWFMPICADEHMDEAIKAAKLHLAEYIRARSGA